MNFKEAFNLNDNMSYEEKYTLIVNGLGYDTVKSCVPFSREIIIEALHTDENLNNLPLRTWDNATGYRVINSSTVCPTNTKLVNLCRSKGITSYSLADLVCILKRCAVMWAEEPDLKQIEEDL